LIATGIRLCPQSVPSPGLSPKNPGGRGDALDRADPRSNSPFSPRNEGGGAGAGPGVGDSRGRSAIPVAALSNSPLSARNERGEAGGGAPPPAQFDACRAGIAPSPPAPLTGRRRPIRLAAIGSRVPQRQAMADHRSGACRVFARRPEDRGSFLFFRPSGPYTRSTGHHDDARPHLHRQHAQPGALAEHARRGAAVCKACRSRLAARGGRLCGGFVERLADRRSGFRELRGRCSGVGLLQPRPAQAPAARRPASPQRRVRQGAFPLSASTFLTTRVRVEGTAQSAWGPAGARSARPGERDSRCRASSGPARGPRGCADDDG
jgi:hypothetical protein